MERTDISSVANFLIITSKCKITNLKLQKLMYFIYGMCLVKDIKLSCSPQAWEYGPVFPFLYHELKQYYNDFINSLIDDIWDERPIITGDKTVKSIVLECYGFFGKLKEFELVGLTHLEGSPWEKSYIPNTRNTDIPDKLIIDYFKKEVIQ